MRFILSFIVAFGVAAIAGQLLIPLLRRLKAGQSIRTDGPTWHMSKQGTPTMGGIMFIVAIGAAVVVYGVLVIALRIITREDLKLIPKGEKIARILHIR